MDCLIEQTHPEIRKRDDVDVSVDSNLITSHHCYISLTFCIRQQKLTWLLFFSASIHRHPLYRTGGEFFLLLWHNYHILKYIGLPQYRIAKDCKQQANLSHKTSWLHVFFIERSWYQEHPGHNGPARLQRQILSFQHHGYTRYWAQKTALFTECVFGTAVHVILHLLSLLKAT